MVDPVVLNSSFILSWVLTLSHIPNVGPLSQDRKRTRMKNKEKKHGKDFKNFSFEYIFLLV